MMMNTNVDIGSSFLVIFNKLKTTTTDVSPIFYLFYCWCFVLFALVGLQYFFKTSHHFHSSLCNNRNNNLYVELIE